MDQVSFKSELTIKGGSITMKCYITYINRAVIIINNIKPINKKIKKIYFKNNSEFYSKCNLNCQTEVKKT